MSDFPLALPHASLEAIFPDVYMVKGMMRMEGEHPRQFSRNMTVIREDGKLTLCNTLRLDGEGLAALDALGTVTNIVKLGSFHGRDDAFYKCRYPQATMWAPAGMTHGRGLTTERELRPDSLPVKNAESFVFETPSNVESILRLDREGGILIPCDSLQNWEPDEFFDESTAAVMKPFFGRAKVGFGWLKHCHPQASDFQRLSKMSFQHLLPSHGTPLLNDARTALRETFASLFPDEAF